MALRRSSRMSSVKASMLHSAMAGLLTSLSKKLSTTASGNEGRVREAMLKLAEYAKEHQKEIQANGI